MLSKIKMGLLICLSIFSVTSHAATDCILTGSGIYIQPHLVLTVAHIIDDHKTVIVQGKVAKVLYVNTSLDIAILKVLTPGKPNGIASKIIRNEKIVSFGYRGSKLTKTNGSLVSENEGNITVCLGMSGGPLLNHKGQLIGLNKETTFETGFCGYTSYFVSLSDIKKTLDLLNISYRSTGLGTVVKISTYQN